MVTSENKDREPQLSLYYEYYHENPTVKVHRPQPIVWYRKESLPLCSSIPDGNQKGIRYTHQSAFHSVSTDGYTYNRKRLPKMALNYNTEAEENTQVTWCSTGSSYRCSVAVTGGEVVGDVPLRNSLRTCLVDISRCGGQDNDDQSEVDVGDYKTDVSSHNASSPECSFRSDEGSSCLSPVDSSTRHMTSECVLKTLSPPIKTTSHPMWDVQSTESCAQYTNAFAQNSEQFRSGPICISDIGMARSLTPPHRETAGYNKAISLYEDSTVSKITGIPLPARLGDNDMKCLLQSTRLPSLNNEKHFSGEPVTGSRLAEDDLFFNTGSSLIKRGSCFITEYGMRSHTSSPHGSNGEYTSNSSTAVGSFNDISSYKKEPEQNMYNYSLKKNMLLQADSLPVVKVQDSVPQYPTVNTPHCINLNNIGVDKVQTLRLGTKEYDTRANDIERNSPRDTPLSIEIHGTRTSVSSQSTQSKFISQKHDDHETFTMKCPETDDTHSLCEKSSSPMFCSVIRYHTRTRRKSTSQEILGSDQQSTSSEHKTGSDEDRGESPYKSYHLEKGTISEDEQRLVVRRVLSHKVSHIENDGENIFQKTIDYPQNRLSVVNRIKIGAHQRLDQGDMPQNISPVGSCSRMGEKQGPKDNNRYLRRSSSMETIIEIGDTDFAENNAACIKKSFIGNQAQIIEEQRLQKQCPSYQRSSPLNHPTQTDSQYLFSNRVNPFHRSTVLVSSGDLRYSGGETATQQVETDRETNLGTELLGPSLFSAEDTALRSRVLVLLWVLLGENRLREVGYPKEPVHRILWRAVDVCCSVAGVKSAAAVPLKANHDCGIDMLCFRDHTHRFLEVCAPTREHWKQFGWAGLTVDAVVRKIYDEELVPLLRLQVLPPEIQQAVLHLSQLDRNPLIQQNSSFKRAVESDSNADTLQTAVVVPAKKKRGRPAKISRKADEGGRIERVMLWRFLLNLLEDPRNSPCIHWVQRDEGIFRILNTDWLARLWGRRHGNPRMTYEKMARAMRTYYRSKVLQPVPRLRNLPRKLVYKFNPAVIHKVAAMKLSCSTFSGRGLNYNTSNNK